MRRVLSDYDLMFCVGADVLKMSVWSEIEPLPETTKVAMVGLRDWEMGKNFPAEIALRADVKETLKALVPLLKKLGGTALAERAKASLAEIAPRNWTRAAGRTARPSSPRPPAEKPLPAEWLMMRLSRKPAEGRHHRRRGPHQRGQPVRATSRSATATASSAMSAAASAGASPRRSACRSPNRQRRVVALIGDGSAMYSIQALWTAANQKLPMTFLISNNGGYQILKNRLKLFHGNDTPIGMDFKDPPIDTTALAKGFGVRGRAGRHGRGLRRGARHSRWRRRTDRR